MNNEEKAKLGGLLEQAKSLAEPPKVEAPALPASKYSDPRFDFKAVFPAKDEHRWKGLSQRQYFVGQALTGLCANHVFTEKALGGGEEHLTEVIARTAVEIADKVRALMAEQLAEHKREKGIK